MTDEIKALADKYVKDNTYEFKGKIQVSYGQIVETRKIDFMAGYQAALESCKKDYEQLEADFNHNTNRAFEIAEERDKALAALSGTEVKEVWEAVSVEDELPEVGEPVFAFHDKDGWES